MGEESSTLNSGCLSNVLNILTLLKLNFDFKNIFIMDASILPSNTGQHPQLTIMSIIKTIIKNNIEQKIFS